MSKFLKYFVAILLLVEVNVLMSQTIILKQSVPENLEDGDDDFGPNRKRFNHTYGGLAFGVDGVSFENENLAQIGLFNSFSIYSGSRYYRNFNKVFASVFDYELSYDQSRLRTMSSDSSQLPVTKSDLIKAKYWFVKMGGSLSIQVNFKRKRGNQLGTYLTLGGYGNWLMFKRFSAKFDNTTSNYSESSKLTLAKMKFMENWEYGPMAKFGRTNLALFAKYRLSDFFKFREGLWEFNELPRLTIGIQFFPGNI